MTSGHYCDGCAQAYYKCVCDKPVEQKKTSPGQTDQLPSEPLQDPIGTMVVRRYEGFNDFEFEYTGKLPDGDYMVYVTPAAPPKNIRVHGWVWKDKQSEDDCYIPSYTPAQHVPKGELLALVDPADLHEPLQNTKWF